MTGLRLAVIGVGHMGRLHAQKVSALAARDSSVVLVAVADPDADLDQFVMIERGFVLGQERVAEAGVAHHDERFELVAESAEVFFLLFAEIHAREV